MLNAAPLTVDSVFAAKLPARQLYDEGSSILYRCAACALDDEVHGHIELRGIAANLDLLVLLHDASWTMGASPR